jgi:hypothetical protein
MAEELRSKRFRLTVGTGKQKRTVGAVVVSARKSREEAGKIEIRFGFAPASSQPASDLTAIRDALRTFIPHAKADLPSDSGLAAILKQRLHGLPYSVE